MPMITYPLNIGEVYTAEDAEMWNCTRKTGIATQKDFAYSVSGADNNITIGVGLAYISTGAFLGKVAGLKTPEVIDLGIPDSSFPRYDVVVVQYNTADLSSKTSATKIVVKKGTAESKPKLPPIVRNDSIVELYICSVYRRVGAVAVSPSDIKDLRQDPELCGLMADAITKIDTKAINTQVSQLIKNLEAEIQAVRDGAEFLPRTGGEVSGTVEFIKNSDASGTADNQPALIIGGRTAEQHIEIDSNEIIAKESATAQGELNLNTGGLTKATDLKINRKLDFLDADVSGKIKYRGVGISNPTLNTLKVTSESSQGFMTMDVNGRVQPTVDATTSAGTDKRGYSLGSSGLHWSSVYAKNGTIQTSDRNAKCDIVEMTAKQERFFAMLKPVTYKFKNGDRIHYGYIAQDVENAMQKCGITAEEFAGFCKDAKTKIITEDGEEKEVLDLDGNGMMQYNYSLRYSEFIALNSFMIQQQQEEINLLKEEIKALKERVK